MLNLNGVVVVENAQLIEEWEEEEEAPAGAAGAAADQPMADAGGDDAAAAAAPGGESADAEAAPAAGGEAAPMEDAAGGAAPAKVVKKRSKKHSVPFASHTAALGADRLAKLYEEEAELALQARIQRETNDAKNALEAYIYRWGGGGAGRGVCRPVGCAAPGFALPFTVAVIAGTRWTRHLQVGVVTGKIGCAPPA